MKIVKHTALLTAGLIVCGGTVSWAEGAPTKTPAPAANAKTPVIRLRFVNTDVSDVLQALTMRTHASIVFPAQLKKLISLNISPTTVDEALRYITAASGLAFRQIGSNYIIAAPADLRQALEPFGESAHLSLITLTPDNALKLLQSALPFLTVREAGSQVLVIGALEDIAQARTLLLEQDKPLADTRQITDVVVLHHASATQVATVLKIMYPQLRAEATGQSDKPGGTLGLAGLRAEVESAKETLRSLDVTNGVREPVLGYRFYDIRYGSAPILKAFLEKALPDMPVLIGPENYAPIAAGFHPISSSSVGSSSSGSSSSGSGSGGASGSGGSSSGGASGAGGESGGTAGQAQGTKGDRARTLVLHGTVADMDTAVKLLEQLDVQPRQVMVEVKIIDTSPERAEELGLKWNWSNLNFFEAPAGTAISSFDAVARQVHPGSLSRMPFSFQAVLSAMITSKEAKLLAHPRIQVIENEEANIFIGDTIRTQISSASANGTTLQVVEFPIGIILLVRPRINADGKITMHVHPVVSTVSSIGAGNLPQTSAREAETTVILQDGETVVIGGLIRDEMSKVVTEVPFLSKLPIIGQLFRNRSINHRHSDIMVFITPHIVK
jgi:type II secretory pathway component GspD/PulD (secretin)